MVLMTFFLNAGPGLPKEIVKTGHPSKNKTLTITVANSAGVDEPSQW